MASISHLSAQERSCQSHDDMLLNFNISVSIEDGISFLKEDSVTIIATKERVLH